MQFLRVVLRGGPPRAWTIRTAAAPGSAAGSRGAGPGRQGSRHRRSRRHQRL